MDRLENELGSRLPFIIAATPYVYPRPGAAGLRDLDRCGGGWSLALFFAAYFVAYEPYPVLYPDLVDDEIVGRAQSSQAIFRGLGTFLALVGGGLLISISSRCPSWPPPWWLLAVLVSPYYGPAGRRLIGRSANRMPASEA